MTNETTQDAGKNAGSTPENPGGNPGQGGGCNPPPDPQQPPGSTPPPAGKKCAPLDAPPPEPKLPEPKQCPTQCCCPQTPPGDRNCFSILIDEQTRLLAEAERTKTFKTDLEDLLKKSKAAKDEYTSDKRKKLVALWQTADAEIVDLIKKLVCAVDCWYCLIECRVCARLNDIRRLEIRLNGDGTLIDKVYSLYDLQYWQQRNVAQRREVFERIRKVLTVWQAPAATIEKALGDNAKLVEDARKVIATDSASAIYDIFLKVLPLHMAIKPPEVQSSIDPKYLKVCECYPGKPDACCGPDIGEQTPIQRLIGWQPYLIKVEDLEGMFCCLVLERYKPAKDVLASAESALAQTEGEIKRLHTEIDERRKSLPADFRAGLTTPIDCTNYQRKSTDPNAPGYGDRTQQPPRDPTQQAR